MYLLPIYFCLCSFLLSLFFGKHLSSKGSIFLNLLSLLSAWLSSFFLFYEVCLLHINCYIHLMPWIQIGYLDIYWSFLFDSISCTMLIVILTVSFFANFYSVEYMLYDPHKIRFFAYLSLFTFTMIMLVTANTLIQLFFGWECVGISSYLLINFWDTRIQANKSSILAVMANKIGDILLLFSSLFVCFLYNSVYFNTVFLCSDYYLNYMTNIYNNLINYDLSGYLFSSKNSNVLYILLNSNIININDYVNYNIIIFTSTFICFFIMFASICKSAQSGFHFWLAEAMEGPTPVSSLLHAATMVTAGIFLTVRCSFLFNNASDIPIYIIFIGSVTSFFSSIIGVTQTDLKKIVAYSTCSQLGYMFLSNGIFSYNITMFHLFNHAFFKALLFLTSGYIIHFLSNEQDLRKMGGLVKIMPFSYICLFIGSISLMGVPYLSGFFSKDTIIESFYSLSVSSLFHLNSYYVIFFSQLLLSISVLCTIFYSVKLLYYVFINSYNGFFFYIKHMHFSSLFIIIPLVVLSILSIFSGFIFSDAMIGVGSTFWGNALNMSFSSFDKIIPLFFSNDHSVSYFFILLPYHFNKFTYYYIFINTCYFTCVSFILYNYYSFFLYFYSMGISNFFNIIFIHVNKKFLFFNRLLVNFVLYVFFKESYHSTYKLIDKQLLEVLGPFGIVFNIKMLLIRISTVSTGLIYHYTGIMVVCLILFIFVVLNSAYFFI